MERKYSIGFLLAALLSFVIIGVAYDINFKRTKEPVGFQNQESLEEQTVATEGQVFKEDCFFLMEEHGYVTVYRSDRETVYEYTNISVSDLPYMLQNEIKNGKYMENIEALYGFLENYSS